MESINFSSWFPRGWDVRPAGDTAVLTPATGRGGYYVLRRCPGADCWTDAAYSVRFYPDTGVGPSAELTPGVPFETAVLLIRSGDTVLRASRGQPV